MTQQPAAAEDAAHSSGQSSGQRAQQIAPEGQQGILQQPSPLRREQVAPPVGTQWQQSTAEARPSGGSAVPWTALELADSQQSRVSTDTTTPQLYSTAAPPWSNADARAGNNGGGKLSKASIALLDDGDGGSLGDGRSSRSQWQRLLQGCCGEVDERAAALAAFAAFMALSHTSLHAVFPSFVRVRRPLACTSWFAAACINTQHSL